MRREREGACRGREGEIRKERARKRAKYATEEKQTRRGWLERWREEGG